MNNVTDNTQTNKTVTFPQEIILDNILPFFTYQELPKCSLVNQEFNALVQNDFTWKTI